MTKTVNEFERFKITKSATNKVVTNVYLSAFEIGKVLFQNAEFSDSSKRVEVYVNFEDVLLLAEDAISGRLFSKIKESDKTGLQVAIGGNLKSRQSGKPISRTMSLALSSDGKTVFVNMRQSDGKVVNNLIVPTDENVVKVSVPIEINKFRKMLLITSEYIKGYITNKVKEDVELANSEFYKE